MMTDVGPWMASLCKNVFIKSAKSNIMASNLTFLKKLTFKKYYAMNSNIRTESEDIRWISDRN